MNDCYEIEINIFFCAKYSLNKFPKGLFQYSPFFPTKGENNLVIGSGSYVGYPSTMPWLNE